MLTQNTTTEFVVGSLPFGNLCAGWAQVQGLGLSVPALANVLVFGMVGASFADSILPY